MSADLPKDPSLRDCLVQPGFRAHIETAIAEEMGQRVEEQERRRVAAQITKETTTDLFLADELGLSTRQSYWLKEYVCALSEQRSQLWHDLEENEDHSVVWQRLRQERREAVGEIKNFRGPE